MSSPTDPPITPRVNGTWLTYGVLLLLVVSAGFTYFGVPRFVIPYHEAKPELTRQALDRLEAALLAYHADHNAFPPQEPMIWHRRINKNVARSQAVGIFAPAVRMLTTPVSFITRHEFGDPYAMPEQFTPPGFLALMDLDPPLVFLHSPGPNLIYNIRPILISDLNRDEALAFITSRTYDPTNGTRSSGDIVRFIPIPPRD